MPAPVISILSLPREIPKPLYPLELPFNPKPEPECPPAIVPIQIDEYPPKECPKPGTILVNTSGFLPPGYLKCDGSEVSRETYSILFKIIGTYYGDGDYSTTFNLPNLTNDCNPNAVYIIKYDLWSDTVPYCPPQNCSGEPQPVPPTNVNIQVLVYPLPYTPPPGTILQSTVGVIPPGYLLCDGSEVSRTSYSILFNAIGTYYGEGDGSTTFNIPNLYNECYPNIIYIIKYDLTQDVTSNQNCMLPPINGSECCSTNNSTIPSGPLNIQILSYPLPYTPPPGTILLNTTNQVPDGYLLCDGSTISRTTYSILFNMIGTFYGAGDGSTTFKLPNLSTTSSGFKYIIRYSEPNNSGIIPQPTIDIQVLPYPLPYTPPPGTILLNTTNQVPDGYLLCDGNEISRVNYNVLFNMIGTYYGAGDGSTTFKLPNLNNNNSGLLYIIRYADPDVGTSNPITNPNPQPSPNTSLQILSYPLGYIPPPGTVLLNTVNYVAPDYLVCNGAAISREKYHYLFNVIDIYYGPGDGVTTFNIPNLPDPTSMLGSRYIIRYQEQVIPTVIIQPNLLLNSFDISNSTIEITSDTI